MKVLNLRNQFWLTRIVFLRYLAFIYLIAFFIAFHQNGALIGDHGLTPAKVFIERYRERFPSNQAAFFSHPTIFWFIEPSTENVETLALVGGAVSFVILIAGHGSMIMLLLLWLGYMSIVNIGQTWYSFGWESQLLEVGFLSIFGVPLVGGWWGWLWSFILGRRSKKSNVEKEDEGGEVEKEAEEEEEEEDNEEDDDFRFPRWTRTPWIFIWGNRWLLFRVMLGAGLIKIRGDPCWRDLTCMNYHYQTQPVPNPISNYFHSTPETFHKMETGANHLVELLAPWLLLIPERRCQMIGGMIQILFQVVLITTGNYAYLNWLTILPAIVSMDDEFWSFLFSDKDRKKAARFERVYRGYVTGRSEEESEKNEDTFIQKIRREYFHYPLKPLKLPSLIIFIRRLLGLAIAILIGCLSYPVVVNMASSRQVMNMNFDPFRIVNTYGLFGSITKTRNEVILQGTKDKQLTERTRWKEFEFRCKPGNIDRTPCFITPYHLRIDWLMWFAAFQNYQQCPWLVHIAYKILIGDHLANDLLDPNHGNPFFNQTIISRGDHNKDRPVGSKKGEEEMKLLQKHAPKYVRAVLYEYRYRNVFNETENEKDQKDGWEMGKYWKRKWVGLYMPAIDRDNPSMKHFLRSYGMIEQEAR